MQRGSVGDSRGERGERSAEGRHRVDRQEGWRGEGCWGKEYSYPEGDAEFSFSNLTVIRIS